MALYIVVICTHVMYVCMYVRMWKREYGILTDSDCESDC